MTNGEKKLSFAQRYGYQPIQPPLILEQFEAKVRIGFFNTFHDCIYPANYFAYDEQTRQVHGGWLRSIYVDFFQFQIGRFPSSFDNYLSEFFHTSDWLEVIHFIEFIIHWSKVHQMGKNVGKFVEQINRGLEKNNSGYRIHEEQFIPITNCEELEELSILSKNVESPSLAGINNHLKASISLLTSGNPDHYRNSIKESISMVGTIARVIAQEGTLGAALKALEKQQHINTQLKNGFEKLYAYSNGPGGIRHELMDLKVVEPEIARYFLISCSAFTNYLIEKARQLGVVQ